MIKIEDATRKYGDRTLWEDVSTHFRSGRVTALTGASGSGKSTLLNCIGGLESLTSGAITVDGFSVSDASRRRLRLYRRDTLGFLFQDYALVPDRRVEYNLRLAVPKATRDQLEEALEHVGLPGYSRRFVYELSGGEQQRVALARLVLKKPTVILADEPTGALDEDNSIMVIQSLRDLADHGSTVVVATHSPEVTAAADDRLHLEDGTWSITRGQ
ncbi:ATP-binding cassette domain-containing protein [Corynebacterium uterequi]|uniref:ABC-type antimicrobial peptide transport system, ATPase component n=1 Tax=Corynebacterium uterequi TaxID=1072256 RepID=A0A0G3HET4_9CORY|nr:ATP-binding cassette domain-containing protein [Corynebacterium uterequi]AKK11866.1 ABC-type antimicrobial peptide transport system, ATPase component [Corynebacterium uterequi]